MFQLLELLSDLLPRLHLSREQRVKVRAQLVDALGKCVHALARYTVQGPICILNGLDVLEATL